MSTIKQTAGTFQLSRLPWFCPFLNAFGKLQNGYLLRHVCLYNCLCVRVEQDVYHCTNFHDIWHLRNFRKYVEKIQASLKSGKNNRYFTWRPVYIYDISMNSFQKEKCFRHKLLRNLSTRFTFNNSPLPRKTWRLWDNVEKQYSQTGHRWQYNNTAQKICVLRAG
jgi:hypothetical protein